MIKVSVPLLEKQPVELEGEEPPELFELGPADLVELASSIHYHLTAKLIGGEVLAKGSYSYRISGECARCLQPTEQQIEGDICLLIPTGQQEIIDLTPEFREETLLALPMNLVCSEDCPGLCPECGAPNPCGCSNPDSAKASPWSALDDLNLKK